MSGETLVEAQKPVAFGSDLPQWPQVDFSEFGEVESKPLSRVQKLTAQYMLRNLSLIHI